MHHPDMVIHCGDAEGSEYALSSAAECPVYIVLGNNDFFSDLPREITLDIGSYKVWVTHGHNYYVSMGNETIKKEAIDRGVLYTSGMIAGEGLVGILLAVFAIIPLASARGGYLGDFINLSALDNGLGAFLVSPAAKIVSLIVFGLLMLTMCKFTIWHKENRK